MNKNLAEHNKATRFPHNDPTKGGRNVSIRKQIKELLQAEGLLTIPAAQVANVNEDGSVTINVPTEMQLAMKIKSWAMGKKGTESLRALQMIMEQIDGKPTQPVDINDTRQSQESFLETFRDEE